jgi:glyoxylase-like metal-dependent hydrolase (beta-lactamase superfamily II)
MSVMSTKLDPDAGPLNQAIRRTALFPAALLLVWAMAAADGAGRAAELDALFSRFRDCHREFAQGRDLLGQGKLDDAAQKFSACTDKMPEHAYAHYYLANIHYLRQNHAAALAAIERAEAHIDTMMRLDAVAREQRIKDMDDAEILLARAYEATRSCMERMRIDTVAMQVEQEEMKARESAGRERLFREELRSEYACMHGNILFKLQRFDDALERYAAAVQANARNSQAANNIIAIFYLARRFAEADRCLQEAETAGIGDQINLQLKALVYQALQRPTTGILEEEYAPASPAEELRAVRFTANVNGGQDGSPPLFENAYIAYSPSTMDAMLIDPGSADPRIAAFVKRHGLRVRMILNTHGHSDHSCGNRHFAALYQAKIVFKREDEKFYAQDPEHRGLAQELIPAAAGFPAGSVAVRFIPTPGHTPGSGCFLIGPFLFSGDSLFEKNVGRMDAATPAQRLKKLNRLVADLRQAIRTLPAATWVLPGHGRAASLAQVLEVNPYIGPGNRPGNK